jgi:hypothetical protein
MPTPNEMIERYVLLRDYIKSETEAFEEHINKYKNAMDVIAQGLLEHLDANGLQNVKSEHGTAYKQDWLRAKVGDRDAFIAFVEDGHWDFADLRVLKEPVTEYIKDYQNIPPGITIEQGTKVNVRS